jgi:hypothetical protein
LAAYIAIINTECPELYPLLPAQRNKPQLGCGFKMCPVAKSEEAISLKGRVLEIHKWIEQASELGFK